MSTAPAPSAAVGPTARLASWAASLRFEDLPEMVVRESKRCLLDHLGLVIGASDEPAVQHALAIVQLLGGEPRASVLGTTVRTSVHHAALVNGIASHVLDYDDTHLPTIIHPTGSPMAAALPIAEWRSLSGRALIAAFAAGFEVECRIGMSVYPAHYDVGWHITGTAGVFGAAVAAAKLLDLDAQRVNWSIGMASSQAAGLREQFGFMTKSLHVGKAAANGILSALLASQGFDSSERSLEAPRGFCNVLSTVQDYDQLTEGLGERWAFPRNGIKPYACGVVTHPGIDGVRLLRNEYGLTAEQVEAIEMKVHPLVLELTGKREPRVGLEGKFSIYHCAAMALIEGAAGPSQFSDEAVTNPEAVALQRKVSAEVDPSLREEQAIITIRLSDGRVLTKRIDAATGTPDNPMSDAGLEAKYRDLVWPFLPAFKQDRLLELVRNVDKLEDIGAIAELLVPLE
ncbi:MAG: MmgE/PrpD family protein [Chloroflexi bacterium]|nr:MmgE/PrpD family protein [Chloroflexota bacterium]